jgi:HlyD family secretion protein
VDCTYRMKHIISFSFLLLLLLACGQERERVKPLLESITESVYASGVVKATNQYTVYPTVSGILRQVAVQPGDSVAEGTALFALDTEAPELNAQSARLALDLSRENSRRDSDKLREMELQVNLAHKRYQLDSSLFERQQRLWEQKIGTQMEYEQRQLAFAGSRTGYQAARRQLAQLKTQLRNEHRRASLNYQLSQKTLTDHLIRSSVHGRVFDVYREVGELVSPQTPLAVVGQADSFLLELEVDENDITALREGQAVAITLDAYKGQVFEAVVQRINPIMKDRSRTFTVEARFVQPPPVLYPNLTVEANIIIRAKENALTIPRKYLVEGNYVLLDQEERREVKTGLRDFRKVEILEGLATAEFIYKP